MKNNLIAFFMGVAVKKKTREKRRLYGSSFGKTYWSFVEGTHTNYWFHMGKGKNFPDVIGTELEIPNCLFIFDKQEI